MFRHLTINPLDYDLLGLHWDTTFIDTYLPFGISHGRQNFHHISDAVRYILHCHGYSVINILMILLVMASGCRAALIDCLRNVLECLGLTISEKKPVPPSTRAVCLGILIDT